MDKYAIAAQVELAGLDKYEGRLSYAQQRTLFDRIISGKKRVKIDCDNQGTLCIEYGAWEGNRTSYAFTEVPFCDIATYRS